MDKTALIKASSELYSQHFCLIAQHFNNPAKAFSIIEQVRGRVTTDMLMAGSVTPQEARKEERTISQLQLKLMAARSTAEERNIRDQIFMAEQARWVTPDVSILKARAHTMVGLDRVERSLSPSSLILEYVVADPQSYCLVISHGGSRLVPLVGKGAHRFTRRGLFECGQSEKAGSRGGAPTLRRFAPTYSPRLRAQRLS